MYKRIEEIKKDMISVPYRGIDIYNTVTKKEESKFLKISVPYRGIDIYNKNHKRIDDFYSRFPSPIGELIFITKRRFASLPNATNLSPLSGN